MEKAYVAGIDFGTASARAILVNAVSGEQLAMSVFEYKRWSQGLFCNPAANQFRQHPLDYIECLETVMNTLLDQVSDSRIFLKAIAIDTTSSTPCLTDKQGNPLALSDAHKDNPNAMFVLWKDHTATQEADEINQLSLKLENNYTKYTGKTYSSEWFWAKLLHILRTDERVRQDACSVIELCDWLPGLLTGNCEPGKIKLSRCSAGHKALWAEEWNGFPPSSFFTEIDPLLSGFVQKLNPITYTCDQSAGFICREWAKRLGLNTDVLIGIGNTDAHAGAVGAGVNNKTLVQNIGTSSCIMAVMPYEKAGNTVIEGISGQVDGSIIPGMIGFEAGISAFGDVYAWLKDVLIAPVKEIMKQSSLIDSNLKEKLTDEISSGMLQYLTSMARTIDINENTVWATDWLNGRRNPYNDHTLRGTMGGLSLSTNAYDIFYSLVESTAFATKAIIDHLASNGVVAERIVATGGISHKSPFVMQVLSDTLNRPIEVSNSEQACALGSAMFAATVAGFYPTVEEAQAVLLQGIHRIYEPDLEKHKVLMKRYTRYEALGKQCKR